MSQPSFSPTATNWGAIIFGLVLLAAWLAFAVRIRQLIRLMRLGRPENRFDHIGERVKYFTLMVLGQRGVLRDPLPGIAHFFTFWGFIIIQLDALNLWAQGFNFTIPVISSRPFAVILDIFIIFAFLAIIEFTYPSRRAAPAPAGEPGPRHGRRLYHPRPDHVGARHAVLLRGLRLRRQRRRRLDALRCVGRAGVVGHRREHGRRARQRLLGGERADGALLPRLLPNSKHLHLLATPFNVFFRNLRPIGALDPIPNLEEREDYGVRTRSTSSPGSSCWTATPAPSAGAATACVPRWRPTSRSGRKRSSSALRRSCSPRATCIWSSHEAAEEASKHGADGRRPHQG